MANRDIELQFRSTPKLLCDVRAVIRSYLTNHGVETDKVQEVVLAVDEACTNSIRHAYSGKEDKLVELSLSSGDGWIELELRDSGVPAPYDRIERKTDEAIAAAAMTPGGLGMHLIYSVFDDVTFTPGSTEGNTILMRLRCA